VLDRFLGLLGTLRAADVVDCDIDALLAEADRYSLANPGTASGDDGDLALQSFTAYSSLR
jgi:hypothetical protein